MNKILVFSLLLICELLCCLALSVISPFFPPFAKEKGISEATVGLIFSANPAGAIIATLILGKIMTEQNRFKFMISSLIIQAIGLFLFAVTEFEDSANKIIATAIVARLINGFATSSFTTPFFAFIPVLFPESIEQKISIAEIFAALGFLLGPVLGSIAYSIGGYQAPFIFIGSLALILVPIIGIYFFRLNLRNRSQQQDEKLDFLLNTTLSADQDQIPLDYLQVLKIYPVLMTSVSGFMVNFMFNYLAPIFADQFDVVYGASPTTIGYYYCVMPSTYLIISLIMGNVKRGKTNSIMIGGFVIGISAFFAGPDKTLTTLDHKIYISLTAIGIMGMGAAPMVIYNIPVVNECLSAYYPNRPIQCANMSSALCNATTFLGELLAPILSGIIVRDYSFDTACSVLGCIGLVQAIFYIPVCVFQTSNSSRQEKIQSKQLLKV